MHALYKQISSLKVVLDKDDEALSWFNLTSDAIAIPLTPTTSTSEFPSTPSAPNLPGLLRFHRKERFQGQWYLLKTWKPSKCFFTPGGLASPPETRVNSPIFAIGAPLTLQKGNLSPMRCVNPRDLHDSTDFLEDPLESQEGGNDLMEQESGDPFERQEGGNALMEQQCGVQSHSTETPATSKCISYYLNTANVPKAGLDLSDDDAMGGVQSRQSSPHLSKDGGPAVDVESREPKDSPQENDSDESMERLPHPQEDDSTTVGIQSRQPSPHPPEDGASMARVKSRELPSDTDGDGGGGRPANDDGKLNDDFMDVESKGPLTESDGVEEEGRSANPLGIVGANPTNSIESRVEEMTFDFGSLDPGMFEPRRSSRKIPPKNEPRAWPTANFVEARKSSRVKKMPPSEKEDILFQASL
jgi:hypothetical protein